MGLKSRPEQILALRALIICNPGVMNRLTYSSYCSTEDYTARERTGSRSSYAEAKKIRPLTHHANGTKAALSRLAFGIALVLFWTIDLMTAN